MEFKSINPYNNDLIETHQGHTSAELNLKLDTAHEAFISWRNVPISQRIVILRKAGEILKENLEKYATMISLEVGKPISESRAEVTKCTLGCDYYANNAEAFLANEIIETDAKLSFVIHEPIGAILAIMPWNFPFWQVFRFAAPTLTAGNTALLKHAPNVFGCAKLIEEIFIEAGYPSGVFQNLFVHHDQTEHIIAHNAVKAVSLTGSEKAGSTVAAIAGKYIKKSLLELGGNNAFIVWEDADIDLAVKTAIIARMRNNGQSCIAAKRFILIENIYDEFVSKYIEAVKLLISGDPMDEATNIGTLARLDLADALNDQIKFSIEQGAKLLFGGHQQGCYFQPTVLGNVRPGMPAFNQETFGPLAAMIKARDIIHAFELSEMSNFGLGVSIFTKNIAKAVEYAHKVSDGAYFINQHVRSDPRLPFGGTKRSGYGRELAKDGIMEFVNKKTVYVK